MAGVCESSNSCHTSATCQPRTRRRSGGSAAIMPLRLLLLLLCMCWWPTMARAAGNKQWTRRDSAPKITSQHIAERDPLLFNMFEVLISSLDDKFQAVSSLEKSVQTVLARLEKMDGQLQQSHNVTSLVLARLDALERTVTAPRPPPTDSCGPRLAAVDARLRQLQLSVSGLRLSAANRTGAASPRPAPVKRKLVRSRGGRAPEHATDSSTRDADKMVQTLGDLRTRMVAMDTRLGAHMDHLSRNVSALMRSVSDVSAVLLLPEDAPPPPPPPPPGNSSVAAGHRSKLDLLVNKIQPLMEVSSKMDEVWNVVVGTKSSIDDLVPKSDELIHTTSRQERAINSIHSDLQAHTKQIIDNLGMVEQRLGNSGGPRAAEKNAPRALSAAGRRPTEPSKRYIRPVAFPTRPTTSAPTAVVVGRLDKEAPFDLLDEQFLKAHENRTTVSKAGSSPARAVSRGRPPGIVFPGRTPPASGPSASGLNASFVTAADLTSTSNVGGYSCSDFLERGVNKSGIYYLHIRGTTYWYLKVFCEMEAAGGGWTVIQRRGNYGESSQQSFNQDWEEYKQGFGSPTAAFWLGNENIFMLTNTEDYQLRIELEDFDGEKRYAQYGTFKLRGEEDNYTLEIGGYEGNAGDSMNDPWYGSNLNPFSTFDRDNDRSSLNCANMLKGGWWWRSCGRGLNGLYLTDPSDVIARQELHPDGRNNGIQVCRKDDSRGRGCTFRFTLIKPDPGIVWYRWRGWDYSLKRSVMMIRPSRVGANTPGAT